MPLPSDVVQRPDVAQFEPFAAPRPGKIESDLHARGRRQQPREVARRRRTAFREIAPEFADPVHRRCKPAEPGLECLLVRGEGWFQPLGIAFQHAPHLGEAEAERAQCGDVGRPIHVVGTIGAPSRLGTDRHDEATLLVEPQGLGGNTETPGGLGCVQEFGGKAHDLPRSC